MSYDSDSGVNWFALRAVVVCGLLICVAMFKSCQEVKYAMGSKQASATVYRVNEETARGRRGREYVRFVSMYKWKDAAGEERTDGISERDEASFKVGDVIEIDYLENSSRLKGQVEWVWPGILLGGVVVGGLAALPLILEAWQIGEKKPAPAVKRAPAKPVGKWGR